MNRRCLTLVKKYVCVLLCFSFILSLLPSVTEAEDDWNLRYLDRAIQFLDENTDQSNLLQTVEFLATVGDWERAFESTKRLDAQFEKPVVEQLIQKAILAGQVDWLRSSSLQIDWEADHILATQAIYAATQGDFETGREITDRMENQLYRGKICCAMVKHLVAAGNQEAANSAFAYSLSQSEDGASWDLYRAAMALRNPVLIKGMYSRMQDKYNQGGVNLEQHIEVMGRAGLFVEAWELAAELSDNKKLNLEMGFLLWAEYLDDQRLQEEVVRIASDPETDLFKGQNSLQFVCEYYLKKQAWDQAIEICDQFIDNMFGVTKFANVSIALSKAGRVADARDLVQRGIKILEQEEEKKADQRFSNTRIIIRSYADCGAALYLLGDETAAEKRFSQATELAFANENNQRRLYDHPTMEIINAYIASERPRPARDLLIKLIEKGHVSERTMAEAGASLRPLIRALVKQHGRQSALIFLTVLKSRTPRVRMISNTAIAQLLEEGPDADLDWILPRRKDVPLLPLFFALLRERLHPEMEQTQKLLQAISSPQPRFEVKQMKR